MTEKISKIQSVSNIFNTDAHKGIGPFNKKEIRSRLISDLFFSEKLIIPATSLLCNPITSFLIKKDRIFFESLLKEKSISPILTNQADSFIKLIDMLKVRKATSLRFQKFEVLISTAKFLDEYIENSDVKIIDQVQIDNLKTEISIKFMEALGRLIPDTKNNMRKIESIFDNEYETKGIISGSWWNRLPKDHLKELKHVAHKLNEIGTMVFDLAHTKVLKLPLIGHTYRWDFLEVGKIANSFLPSYEFSAQPGIIDSNEIDLSLFHESILEKLNSDDFGVLFRGTKRRRKLYFKSLNDLLSNPNEDQICQVKARLDEYLVSISEVFKSTKLSRYTSEFEKARKIKSDLIYWKVFEKIIPAIIVGVSSIPGLLIDSIGLYNIFILMAAASMTKMTNGIINSKKKSITDQYTQKISKLEHIRPVSFQLNLKAE